MVPQNWLFPQTKTFRRSDKLRFTDNDLKPRQVQMDLISLHTSIELLNTDNCWK